MKTGLQGEPCGCLCAVRDNQSSVAGSGRADTYDFASSGRGEHLRIEQCCGTSNRKLAERQTASDGFGVPSDRPPIQCASDPTNHRFAHFEKMNSSWYSAPLSLMENPSRTRPPGIQKPDYDGRTRPWYATGKADSQAVLTEPYKDSTTGEILISAVARISDAGQLLGVFGVTSA